MTVVLLLLAGLFLTEGLPDNRTVSVTVGLNFCITLSSRTVSDVEEQLVATVLSYSAHSFWVELDVFWTVQASCSSSFEHWKDSGKSMYHLDYTVKVQVHMFRIILQPSAIAYVHRISVFVSVIECAACFL